MKPFNKLTLMGKTKRLKMFLEEQYVKEVDVAMNSNGYDPDIIRDCMIHHVKLTFKAVMILW